MMCQSPSSSSSSTSSPFSSLSSSSSSNSSESETDSMEPLRLHECSTLECSGISSRKAPDEEEDGLLVILFSCRSLRKRSAQAFLSSFLARPPSSSDTSSNCSCSSSFSASNSSKVISSSAYGRSANARMFSMFSSILSLIPSTGFGESLSFSFSSCFCFLSFFTLPIKLPRVSSLTLSALDSGWPAFSSSSSSTALISSCSFPIFFEICFILLAGSFAFRDFGSGLSSLSFSSSRAASSCSWVLGAIHFIQNGPVIASPLPVDFVNLQQFFGDSSCSFLLHLCSRAPPAPPPAASLQNSLPQLVISRDLQLGNVFFFSSCVKVSQKQSLQSLLTNGGGTS